MADNVRGETLYNSMSLFGGQMRKTVFSLAVGAMIAPAMVSAQDATKAVAGGGEVAAGWQMRVDPRAGSGAPPKFAAMGPGWHVTSGSRAIYWRPADVAKGNYTVEGTFALSKAPAHAEAYGIVFAGRDLTTPKQNYMYFTLGGNGTFLIKHRAGDADSLIHTIANWTPSDAIAKADASGKSTDKLAVVVGAQKVQYMINGKEVFSQDRSQVPGGPDGIAGIRVSHNLDVHISDFKITPGK
jgi:hypothetical protein